MLATVIDRARRRLVFNEALRRLALSAAVAAAGLSVILIAGTRWLEWWTLATIALVTLIYGAIATRRSAPSRYAAAIRLDRAAHLNDSLSTALHFGPRGSEFAARQRESAEQAAAGVDVNAAIPLAVPRALYAAAVLLAAAGGLFALRYSLLHTLDLRAPLTQVFFEDQALKRPGEKLRDEREALRRRNLESAESLLAKMGVPIGPEDAKNPDALDRAIDQALAAPPAGAEKAAGKNESGSAGAKAGDQPRGGDPLDDKAASNPSGEENKESGMEKSPKGGGNGQNSSLLSKLKDAVSNMFSKSASGKDSNAQKNGGEQQNQQAKSDKAKGEKGAGKGQEQGEASADAQAGQQEADGREGQDAQSKAASKSAQQSGQSGSGVGSQDGSKDLRAAEQLRAMGKISEILGKRAATVTGETTIEVQSGNQKLNTAYSNKAAAHGEADGDVSRDEIPLSLQSYIREYFERVHKSAAPKAPRAHPENPS